MITENKKSNSRGYFERSFMRQLKSSSSQQEAVGFVIIVLIVLILGVIFLGISLRNKDKGISYEDAELSNFLTASSSFTTECYQDSEPFYRTLGDLTKDCYLKREIICPSQRTACEILNETYSKMMLSYAPAGKLAYYQLKFYHEILVENTEDFERERKISEFMSISSGNSNQCGAKRGGRVSVSTEEGNVVTELEVCPAA